MNSRAFVSKNFNENLIALGFVILWIILNLIQARFTELIDDEAYYWMYSRHLNWGYFDHPPMTALLIRLGYSIFHNELGVRFIFVLMTGATIIMIWFLLPKGLHMAKLFAMAIPAMALMHFNAAGFVATPDPPLVFFSTLFLIIYKRYLDNDHWIHIMLLSIIISAMMYTKYHAVLIIVFAIMANPPILRKRSFYITGFLVALCFLPYVWWQIRHHFPTLSYHFVGRNNPMEFRSVYQYILNQILVTGPVIGVILLYVTFRSKPASIFEKTLKYIAVGSFTFFLVASLKGHVEPHWTSIAFIPLLVVSLPLINRKPIMKKWFIIGAVITIPVILVVRLYLMVELFHLPVQYSRYIHDKDVWAAQVKKAAGGRPVVFRNSYQRASLYAFYTGLPVTSRNNIFYRKNQYDIWDFESRFQGQEVLYHDWSIRNADTLTTVHGDLVFKILNPYYSNTRIIIEPLPKSLEVKKGTFFWLECRLINPGSDPAYLNPMMGWAQTRMYTTFFGDNVRPFNYKEVVNDPELSDIPGHSALMVEIKVLAPLVPGRYQLRVSLGSQYLVPGLNSPPIKVRVTK